jgi:hypothetical protein
MLIQYSSNPGVSSFVDKLVREMRQNPYDPENRSATVAGVVEQAYYHFGRKRARSIRITVH